MRYFLLERFRPFHEQSPENHPSAPSKKHPTCYVTIREQALPRDLPQRTVFTTLAHSGYPARIFKTDRLHPVSAPPGAEPVRTRLVEGSISSRRQTSQIH